MGDWVKAGRVDDIGPGGLMVSVGGEDVLLVLDGGTVRAIAGLCSHQDMELYGGHAEAGAWVCPHHGARFDMTTGRALSMPAVEPIAVYKVRIEEGTVFVEAAE